VMAAMSLYSGEVMRLIHQEPFAKISLQKLCCTVFLHWQRGGFIQTQIESECMGSYIHI
jgi:hypothetical protein